MLRSGLKSGIRVQKCSSRGCGLKLVYSELKQYKVTRTAHFSNFRCKTLKNWPLKQSPNAGKYITYICHSTQATVTRKNENERQTRSYFQELLFARKKEAHRSVLLGVSKKEDIPYAVAKCEKFGDIINVFSYSGESGNCFLLIEFSDEIETQKLLFNCKYKNIVDAFPIYSRIIQFEKKSNASLPKLNIKINEDSKSNSSLKFGCNISELIEGIYLSEKLSELDTRLRYFFCSLIKDSVSGLFPHCDVLPFGSSVNGLGRYGCDLDVMIRLYPEKVNGDDELSFLNRTCIGQVKSLQQKAIYCLGDYFRTFFPGIPSAQKILRARMPILKINHKILRMDCDISINNMSAVFMSDIIHFCGEIDPRVRPLLYAIKKWAKECGVTYDAPGTWITNFGLTSLMVFFLQNRPNPILPSLNNALVILGEDNTADFELQYLKSVEEWKSIASLNKESLAVLLKEFLSFLAIYPFNENILSLMSGEARPQKAGVTLWIQYPFEEDLNITKNVSDYEFCDLIEKAKVGARYLENNLKQNVNYINDFSLLLGMHNLKRNKPQKMDVKSLLQDHNNNSKSKTVKHKVS